MIDFTVRQLTIISGTKINTTAELALFWHRLTILGFIYIYAFNKDSKSDQSRVTVKWVALQQAYVMFSMMRSPYSVVWFNAQMHLCVSSVT